MKRYLEKITFLWALMGGVLLLVIVCITMINVTGFSLNLIAKHFGKNISGLTGYEDAVSFAVGVAALSFLPYCHIQKSHIAVDLFNNMLPVAFQKVLVIISDVIIVFIALFLGFMLLAGAVQLESDGTLSPVLEWQVWPFFLPGAFSCFLWSLIAGHAVYDNIKIGTKVPLEIDETWNENLSA